MYDRSGRSNHELTDASGQSQSSRRRLRAPRRTLTGERAPPRRALSDLSGRSNRELSDASEHSLSSRRRVRVSRRTPPSYEASDSESTDDDGQRRLPRRALSRGELRQKLIAQERSLLDQLPPNLIVFGQHDSLGRLPMPHTSSNRAADFGIIDSESEEEDILGLAKAETAARTMELSSSHASLLVEALPPREPQKPRASIFRATGFAATLATTASTLASSISSGFGTNHKGSGERDHQTRGGNSKAGDAVALAA